MSITDFNIYIIITIVITFFSFIILVWSSITFIIEKEFKAASRAILLTFLIPAIFILPLIISYPEDSIFGWVILIIPCTILIIILLPINLLSSKIDPEPSEKHDERDIMFSRNELIPGTNRFIHYYKRNPQNKQMDEKFRANPGLLSTQSTFYHPLYFASANANFNTVKAFHQITDGNVSSSKTDYDQEDLKTYIKWWAKYCGAHSIGITELKDYHLYSYGGRNHSYDIKIKNDHKYAIAITVEMDYLMIAAAPKAPVITESAYQYLQSGTIAVQIASFIRELGYSAKAHIDGHFEVICPLVARDAGLGEIGRMGLLMTPDLGPRVRIAVVTTDLELPLNKRDPDYSTIDFCNSCKKCYDNCPANAITDKRPDLINNVERWKIEAESCFTYWTKIGTDCGKCMFVCPYSHPDYLLHKFMRFFVKRSYLFRRFAVYLDDFFYGKKPGVKEIKI